MAKLIFPFLIVLSFVAYAKPAENTVGHNILKPALPTKTFDANITSAPHKKAFGYKYRQESSYSTGCKCITWSTDSTVFEYDVNGNVISEIFYVGQRTHAYQPFTKTIKRYNPENRLIHQTLLTWTDSDWTETQQVYYQYADGGTSDSVTFMKRDGPTSAWTNYTLTTNRYDEQGNVIEWLYHNWDGNSWKPSMGERFIRTGETNGIFHEEIYQIYRTTIGWVDTSKEVNVFSDGLLREKIKYLTQNNTWQPSWRYTDYEYIDIPEYKQQAYIHQLQQNGSWKDFQRQTFKEYPNLISLYTKEEKLSDGTWRMAFSREEQYNKQGLLVATSVKDIGYTLVQEKNDTLIYNDEGYLIAENGTSTRNGTYAGEKHIRYGNFVTIGMPLSVPDEQIAATRVYPNPTQHSIYIEPQDYKNSPLLIELVDVKGNTLNKQTLIQQQQRIEIDLSSYQSGLYLLRLIEGNAIRTHKIVKK